MKKYCVGIKMKVLEWTCSFIWGFSMITTLDLTLLFWCTACWFQVKPDEERNVVNCSVYQVELCFGHNITHVGFRCQNGTSPRLLLILGHNQYWDLFYCQTEIHTFWLFDIQHLLYFAALVANLLIPQI